MSGADPRHMFRALLKTMSRQMTRACYYRDSLDSVCGSSCEFCGGTGKIVPKAGDPDFLGNVFTTWLMWMMGVKDSGAHHKFMEMWDVLHEWIPTAIAPVLQGLSESDFESVRILVEEVEAEVNPHIGPTCDLVSGQALNEDELRQLGVIE